MNYTKEVITEQIDICLSAQDPIVQLGRYIENLREEIIQEAEQRRDEEWRKAIQNLIEVSNENSSQDWFSGLRTCKSISFPSINTIKEQGDE